MSPFVLTGFTAGAWLRRDAEKEWKLEVNKRLSLETLGLQFSCALHTGTYAPRLIAREIQGNSRSCLQAMPRPEPDHDHHPSTITVLN